MIKPNDTLAYNRMPERLLPAIPRLATLFQRGYGYEPATVVEWDWNTDFRKWGASVIFADGHKCFSYPKPEPKRYR